ncbi:isoprenoid synthase domain-containing protein [Lasiosphaeria hispida]|uniref:Terpene synthase n=1 Tax=Lasiosphaeria hispida TaxID=260671 RepID=A0AAJ0HFB5_9PEZI|nr:isoprenoid synthase domain-containing protein [Lasiosphaeria hispida]
MAIKHNHPLSAVAPASVLAEPKIHPDHEEIDRDVISYLVHTWEWPSEKAKKGFVSWKLSDVVLFMFPTGDTTRVKLACELLLLGFLMDDWFDNNSFPANTALVTRLQSLLASPSTFTTLTTIERMHATLFARILAVQSTVLPPTTSRAILTTYLDMLACHCDASRGAATALRDYLVFREVDVGMPICVELLYWTEDLAMREGERAALAPLERVANYHVSILNDVFSFEREWQAARTLGQGAVLVNGVRILADETAVSVGAAKSLCLALVRAWEVEFQTMVEEVLERVRGGDGEERLRRAVLGIERRMTGAEAFSWRTSRYL